MKPLECVFAGVCSGCNLIHLPYPNQRENKIADLKMHLHSALAGASNIDSNTSEISEPRWPEIRWVETQNGGMRTRMDLTIENADPDFASDSQIAGLYSRERQTLVDLETCAQLTPELNEWLQDFRSVNLGVKRGSIRLRVHVQGVHSPSIEGADDLNENTNRRVLRGVWLDLANVDIKRLLHERTALDRLRGMAVVEIGQKRKRLVEREGELKLADPVLENWSETYDSHGITIPLFCSIGTFTQPGPIANQVLVQEVLRALSQAPIRKIAEFGSGIGNFTIPLASICDEVRAFEIDSLALEGLSRSLAESGLTERVKIYSGNFQVPRKNPPALDGLDAVLVDPPRSGVGQFLNPIAEIPLDQRPPHFVYVSCFAESFAVDARRLISLGYRMADIAIVDQFPQSPHYEIVSRFELS